MIFALLLEVIFLTFTRVSLHSNILKFSQINRHLFIILQVNARERARNSHFSSRKHIQKENRLSLLEDHVAIGGKKSLNRARFAIIFFFFENFPPQNIEEINFFNRANEPISLLFRLSRRAGDSDKQRKK